MSKHYKTIVLSDIHIGSKWSHTEKAMEFLRETTCDMLILNGDIVDGWHLMRDRNKWKIQYNDFIKLILDKSRVSKIVYIRGNHDDFLEKVLPFYYGNFSIVQDYIYESFGKRYYVFHGDLFDTVTSNIRWLSKFGDKLYSMTLQINRLYNDYRKRKGMEYLSISMKLKKWVKKHVSRMSNFDKNILSIAKKKNCECVICGHIHHAEIRKIGDILYLNSGDWIESMTALVEDNLGEWEILRK